jgi:hypothetical protein
MASKDTTKSKKVEKKIDDDDEEDFLDDEPQNLDAQETKKLYEKLYKEL